MEHESVLKRPNVDGMIRNAQQVQQLIGLIQQASEAEPVVTLYKCGISWLLVDAYERLDVLYDSILQLSGYLLFPARDIDRKNIDVLE
jgi:hypothetical protein